MNSADAIESSDNSLYFVFAEGKHVFMTKFQTIGLDWTAGSD